MRQRLKNAAKVDDNEDDEYYFNFIKENISQSTQDRFEDVLQCQANLQELHLRS